MFEAGIPGLKHEFQHSYAPLYIRLLLTLLLRCHQHVDAAGGGIMSYIPGTEANRQSRAEHGQDPNTYSSGNNSGSNTGGGIMSYIPGTEANRESRAMHGQDPNSYSSGNQSYTGTGSNQGYSNTGGGAASYIPGTQANRESRAMHGQDPNTYSSGNSQSYTGTGSNQGYSNTGGGVASYIPGTQANKESRAMHGQDSSYSSGNTGIFTSSHFTMLALFSVAQHGSSPSACKVPKILCYTVMLQCSIVFVSTHIADVLSPLYDQHPLQQ